MDTKERSRQEAQTPVSSDAVYKPTATPRRPGQARSAAPGRSGSRRKQRPAAVKKAPKRRRRSAQEVVYTQPKPFTRGAFLVRLVSVVAAVLAVTFGISIFFQVQTVTVTGAEKYTAWAVREASGIAQGDNLLTFGKARACGRITAALPYVRDVRIGIKLPDTVNIEIVEFDVVYSIRSQDDSWWLMAADGKVVEKTDIATAGDYTEIMGVRLLDPQPNAQGVAFTEAPDETQPEGVTRPETVSAGEQLSAALNILQNLEANGIIGEVVSVDVGDIGSIELWYGTQYQVRVGDATQLSYKIASMVKAVGQLSDYHTGVLDVSFTTWPDQVGYTPFP